MALFGRSRRAPNPLEDLRRTAAARLAAHRQSGVVDPDVDAALMFVTAWLDDERRRATTRAGANSVVDVAPCSVDALLSGFRG